ncbi:hypothetical protein GMLC_39510 [Geomonas limicola]|uniref:Uncharacterized protein n=1 Tax=Geomonas limicola TaxID=2740186 RepID=A0A6V8NCL3_9BACT|nr:hypothetical protein GMLC_39510 [Geomonas limicola]
MGNRGAEVFQGDGDPVQLPEPPHLVLHRLEYLKVDLLDTGAAVRLEEDGAGRFTSLTGQERGEVAPGQVGERGPFRKKGGVGRRLLDQRT